MQLLSTCADLFFAEEDDVQRCLRPKIIHDLLKSLENETASDEMHITDLLPGLQKFQAFRDFFLYFKFDGIIQD